MHVYSSNMSRCLAFFALVALAAAYPAGDVFPRPFATITETEFEDPSPWFRFPPFGNIFAPLTKLFSSFADIGPRIEVDDDKFRVIVNVKDYKKSDLKVKVKGDFIFVEGAHEAKHDNHDLFASQFFHTYSLPLNASASDVTATLTKDSYLVVTAPISGPDDKEKVVDINVPIVESGEPLKQEKDKDVTVIPVASVDKIENPDKVESLDTVDNVDKVENENVDKVENKNVENVDKVENEDKVERVDKMESVDNVDNVNKLGDVDKVESIDKVENIDQPENVDKVGNVDEPENVDKVDQAVKAETVGQIENEKPENPGEVKTYAIEKTDDTELQTTPQIPYDDEVIELTTPSSDRGEVAKDFQDNKIPQDNEIDANAI